MQQNNDPIWPENIPHRARAAQTAAITGNTAALNSLIDQLLRAHPGPHPSPDNPAESQLKGNIIQAMWSHHHFLMCQHPSDSDGDALHQHALQARDQLIARFLGPDILPKIERHRTILVSPEASEAWNRIDKETILNNLIADEFEPKAQITWNAQADLALIAYRHQGCTYVQHPAEPYTHSIATSTALQHCNQLEKRALDILYDLREDQSDTDDPDIDEDQGHGVRKMLYIAPSNRRRIIDQAAKSPNPDLI